MPSSDFVRLQKCGHMCCRHCLAQHIEMSVKEGSDRGAPACPFCGTAMHQTEVGFCAVLSMLLALIQIGKALMLPSLLLWDTFCPVILLFCLFLDQGRSWSKGVRKVRNNPAEPRAWFYAGRGDMSAGNVQKWARLDSTGHTSGSLPRLLFSVLRALQAASSSGKALPKKRPFEASRCRDKYVQYYCMRLFTLSW